MLFYVGIGAFKMNMVASKKGMIFTKELFMKNIKTLG
ncbi:Uncharacterised protein [Clostridium paraputrificum]|uniref:Uncharacterized protein n=1 Tax=Clostridium paraputrificum TaxID=29363 RepID=A0A6N3FFH0_9CLOT